MNCNKFCLIALFGLLTTGLMAQDRTSTDPESDIFVSALDNVNKIELYPNPAVEYLMVEIKNSDLEKVSFELHSMIGNKIAVEAEMVMDDQYRISLEGYASGYYFLVVRDEYTRFKKAYRFLKN